jgi:ribose/xylose/arabinose/galactoside ABC-type transport system permease subunit
MRRYASQLATVAALVLLVTIASLRYQHFFSGAVLLDLLRDNAYLGIVAVGMTFVILTGGIDLSVGAVLGLTSIVSAKLMADHGWPGYLTMIFAVALGSAFGAFQGLIIARFKLPAFLITLAGLFLARGLAFVVSTQALTVKDPVYQALGGWRYTLPALFLLVFAIAAFLLHFRPFGRHVYAIGGNEGSALLMGLPVANTKVSVYAISGFCAALAGVAHGIYTSSGNATAGTLLELDAIAAVVIGGTLLIGGIGTVIGTPLGVLVLGVIQTAITFEGTLNSWWTKIVSGALLLAFILLQKVLAGRRERSS